MRKALLAVAVAALLLCGCEGNAVSWGESGVIRMDTQKRFVSDVDTDMFGIVVDSHTGVTYLTWKRGSGNSGIGGITVLLNRDGTPVISEGGRR